ncbi:MAG: tRNA 2-thiocytidine biosynthesis protein TtcA [Candidatus Latescibacteria bacterium]|jgi:tRNA 2-thiocytidine biosynthesis protein TtcA|nr:tRNA 2-thiocytidine biosynthesis protein TtcA [Candidatus Latescibacterota bacterium]
MSNKRLSTKKYRYSPLTRYGRLLIRKINRAFKDFNLITDNDRVCVAVSGGKDSLSLLHLLHEHKRFYEGKFSIVAVHAVSDYNPQADKIKEYLLEIFESLGIEYGFVKISVTTDEDGNKKDPNCFWCSWKRREALFKYCVEKGCNKLAFGHHSDDVAETTLLNLVYHGNLDTMLPARTFFDDAFTLIRPLFYIREKEFVRYAEMAGFKTASCVCPNEKHGKRRVMKKLLRDLSKESRQLNANLWRASKIWHDTFGDRAYNSDAKKRDDTT